MSDMGTLVLEMVGEGRINVDDAVKLLSCSGSQAVSIRVEYPTVACKPETVRPKAKTSWPMYPVDQAALPGYFSGVSTESMN